MEKECFFLIRATPPLHLAPFYTEGGLCRCFNGGQQRDHSPWCPEPQAESFTIVVLKVVIWGFTCAELNLTF